MEIIVCLTPTRQFGKVEKDNLCLVTNINDATKFTEDYKEEMSYLLNKYREKYSASTFVCCDINTIVFDTPINNVMDKHIQSNKLAEVLY